MTISKTTDDIIRKYDELSSTISLVRAAARTKAQKLALVFGNHIIRTSQTIVLLSKCEAYIEAHAICRLLFEHAFNLGALLADEKHHGRLLEHSRGEPGRQLKKIQEGQSKIKTLTSENARRTQAYLDNPERENDPKTGLNWEQVAIAGGTDCFLVAYRQYSFRFAHSTLASIIGKVEPSDVSELHENVWTVLELGRLLFREKILNAANRSRA